MVTTLACALALVTTIAQAADPLPSWNDGKAKKAIVGLRRESDEGRLAATSCRQPSASPPSTTTARSGPSSRCISNSLFALDRVKALAPQHPGVEGQGAVRLAAQGRHEGRAGRRRTGHRRDHHGHARRHDHRGVREDREGLDRHGEASRRPSGRTPRWSISRCSNCSPTCARTASRRSSSPAAASSSCARGRRRSTASRPSRSSAAAARLKFEMRDGKPVLVQAAGVDFIDDKAGKPVGIQQHIGRRPIAAFGNSDGDLQMLQWTAAGSGPRFGLYRPPHRRRTRVGLRPQVAHRPARQGPRRSRRQRLDGREHEGRLEDHFPDRARPMSHLTAYASDA